MHILMCPSFSVIEDSLPDDNCVLSTHILLLHFMYDHHKHVFRLKGEW
jgi:hypothetical protein